MMEENIPLEKLEQMEKVGIALLGKEVFENTLAHVQIQRMIKERLEAAKQ